MNSFFTTAVSVPDAQSSQKLPTFIFGVQLCTLILVFFMSVSPYVKSFPFDNICQSLGMVDQEVMGDETTLRVPGLRLLPRVQCLLFVVVSILTTLLMRLLIWKIAILKWKLQNFLFWTRLKSVLPVYCMKNTFSLRRRSWKWRMKICF